MMGELMTQSFGAHTTQSTNQPTTKYEAINRRLPLRAWHHLRQTGLNLFVTMALLAGFLVLTANWQFFHQVLAVYPLAQNIGFVLSLALVLLALLLLVLLLTGYRYTLKPIGVLLLLVAAVTGYFADTYATVYDANMLQNALQTDIAEAHDLLNGWFILRVLVLGVLPSAWLIWQPLKQLSLKQAVLQRFAWLVGCVVLLAVLMGSQSGQYASFFREHKPLRSYALPLTPIYAMDKLASNALHAHKRAHVSIQDPAADAKQLSTPATRRSRLVVMVVGETARADHSPMNGYARNTLPQLSQTAGVTNFSHVTSCGTSTAYSVPCMFSYLGEQNYQVDDAGNYRNVLDTLHRLGINVLWRDNNSDSKGVMSQLPQDLYQSYRTDATNPVCHSNPYDECRDVGMLAGLDDYLKTTQAAAPRDVLIVLHQMGNHGPAYYKRYDAAFAKFNPVCQTNELADCAQHEIINGYDNALLATDDFLAKTIGWLKTHQQDYDVAMLYSSDHGESLGENNVYLHGLPKAFAPEAQRHVLAMMWRADSNTPSFAQPVAGDSQLSHDAITPTLLKLFDVHTRAAADTRFIQ